jgi:hypothetical protein
VLSEVWCDETIVFSPSEFALDYIHFAGIQDCVVAIDDIEYYCTANYGMVAGGWNYEIDHDALYITNHSGNDKTFIRLKTRSGIGPGPHTIKIYG